MLVDRFVRAVERTKLERQFRSAAVLPPHEDARQIVLDLANRWQVMSVPDEDTAVVSMPIEVWRRVLRYSAWNPGV